MISRRNWFGSTSHGFRIFLLAVSIVCIVAHANASTVTNKELRIQIQKLERRLQDYPALASIIGPELKQKRLELLAQLQSDADYLNSMARSLVGPEKTTVLTQAKSITDEIAALQKAVASSGNGQPGATALSKTPSVAARPSANLGPAVQADASNSPQKDPSINPAPQAVLAGGTAPNAPSAASGQTTSAIPVPTSGTAPSGSASAAAGPSPAEASPGSTPQEQLPEPELAPAMQPSSVKLVVDISRDWQSSNFEKGCSNKPNDQTSDNWVIRIAAVPLWPGSQVPKPYVTDTQGNIFIPVLTQHNQAVAPVIVAGAHTYTGVLRTFTRKVDLSFEHLTLSQASDLVQRLTGDTSLIQHAFSDAKVSLVVYQLAATAAKPIDGPKIYRGLRCHLEPTELRKLLGNVDPRRDLAMQVEACELTVPMKFEEAPAMRVRIRALPIDDKLMQSLTLDSESIEKTKTGLKMLADSQLVSASSNPELSNGAVDPELDPSSAISGGEQTVTDPRKELVLIDNPCFHVSVDPLLNGSQITPVVNFRYDYNYFTQGNALIARLHAEGEGADTSKYFQRIQGYGNLTALITTAAGWQFYGGAVGTYSGTKNTNGAGFSEWTAGGQFQLQAPVLTPFNVLAGANSRPTFSVAFGGAGGDATSTETTNFVFNGGFQYTFRPTYQLSVDLKANGGWSNQTRFASHQQYGYFSFVGRYNIKGDWDFLGKYECGRKDPDYRKFCGWQTGFTFLTGR